jgi:hypothetical protein
MTDGETVALVRGGAVESAPIRAAGFFNYNDDVLMARVVDVDHDAGRGAVPDNGAGRL